ncbi:uncharacterized protein FOMMEDRAFT_89286 [Fomitiporia mediterranea MF3/22]|uniref:uncharacterized protein n=1 Tax=Fomitiporia mediterranea (strain MF3/22) TaxID=694068 RepID=UPI0004407436|nr:uncharacterized protein FOMMEDRAFT_89286 [Fomitiporia mediterranea MF3/22]EJD00807.1 hypothetical protein FOMMEDRAFT_89286 [Fomitiporia mediterranea MF3/22]
MQSHSLSSSTRPGASPMPSHAGINTQTKVIDTVAGRILCIADVRGRLSSLNDMAREVNAKAIIHTGDFGFFESSSLENINDRTLKHLTQYSPLIPNAQRSSLLAPDTPPQAIRAAMTISLLSEFPLLLSGQIKLSVPVFTVWGACEDVRILEKFRQGTYDIENLHVLDEATTRCLDIGGVKLRILGLGGAFVPHKMFDNGDGNATIAGGQGTMWTTALQIGELVDTAQRVYDPSETRLLVTHASPGREGIIAQLSLVLKADLTISAGLHFRYTSSWNEFSVQGDFEGFRHKIINGKESFSKIWESVKPQVEAVVDENQRILLEKALSVIERVPAVQPHIGPGGTATGDEPAWKNCWNWNLCDAAYGSLVLDIKEGRVSAEIKSQGFNYAYRRSVNTNATPNSGTSTLPNNIAPSSTGTPAPQSQKPQVVAPTQAAAARSNGPSAAPTPPPQINQNQQQQGSTATSGKETPKSSWGNKTPAGTDTPDKAESDKQKWVRKDKKSFSKKDGTNKDGEDGAPDNTTSRPQSAAPQSGKATPVAGGGPPDSIALPMSPTSGADSPGTQTPRKRHPWTLFMRYDGHHTEEQIRGYFYDKKEEPQKVHFPQNYGKPTRTAFVDFHTEAGMKAGLANHAEKLKSDDSSDSTVHTVVQADDRDTAHQHQHQRGSGDGSSGSGFRGGRGRGRGGSGFAARGFAAAGLTRQQVQADRQQAQQQAQSQSQQGEKKVEATA